MDQVFRATAVSTLRQQFPNLLAVYAFGSRTTDHYRADSDWDLAVLVAGYADPWSLFDTAGVLSDQSKCPVDLLDLRAATTVMQYQVVTTGERWWAQGNQVDLFEAMVLSEMTELNTARAGVLEDIQKTGRIHG